MIAVPRPLHSRTIAYALAILSVLAIPPAARAAHLAVCADGCRFSTIQSAVDQAKSGDTVTIDQGVYFENIVITDSAITLQGAGSTRTIVHGVTVAPVLKSICAATTTRVRLTGLMLTGGVWTPGQEPPIHPRGGGIDNEGCTLDVTGAQIVGNSAEGNGGGISSSGPLRLVDSVVANNKADAAGGMLLTAPAFILRTLVQQNRGTGYHTVQGGGGIVGTSDLTIQDSVIVENSSPTGCCGPGGGIISSGALKMSGTRIAANFGSGMLTTGTGEIVDCTITDNTADLQFSAGGIVNYGALVIARTLVANNEGSGILNNGTMHIKRSVLTGNFGASTGGGVMNHGVLDLDRVSVVDNSAASGGGIYGAPGATTTLEHSSITGNTPDNCAGSGLSCP